MNNYFKRQIQLWGEETQQLLQTKKIAIIGAGGLGSSLCYALGSIGLAEIHIIDFDHVSLHNIHRQIAFNLSDQSKNKAKVNATRIQNRTEFTKVIAHECDFETWKEKKIDVDLLLDATDNLPTREAIDNYAKSVKTPWVYGSVEAFNGQVCLFENASFNDFFAVKEREPQGIATPMVMQIASLQANLALRFLAKLPIKKDVVYYIYFNQDGELITQKFSLCS